jgi:hypothetical protein
MNPRSGRAPGSKPPVSRRRLGLILGGALAAALLLAGALWWDSRDESSAVRATVPAVLGLTEAEAVIALADAGLVAEISHMTSAAGGGVEAVDPEPGDRVAENSVVLVYVPFGDAGTARARPVGCRRSRASLDAVQAALSKRGSTPRGARLASSVDPATCTVRIVSNLLTPAAMGAIVARYGTRVSFEVLPGSIPVGAPGS